MSETLAVAIDTNVILRHLLADHDDHSPRASALFREVRQGKQFVFCPDTAIFEALHILHQRAKVPRAGAAAAIIALIETPAFQMTNKESVIDALQFWTSEPALNFADCYHLVLTKALGMDAIYTFDRKMDRYPGVKRLEPT